MAGKHRAEAGSDVPPRGEGIRCDNTVPTNGPYTWGNGPKPDGWVKRLVRKVRGE